MSANGSWSRVVDCTFPKGALEFELTSVNLITEFTRGDLTASSLVVWFHGAIDQTKVKGKIIPRVHVPELSQYAHQISVSDPTLLRSRDLRLGWYIGHENLNAQIELTEFFRRLADSLGVCRTIYIGSSGGGFASLYYSLQDRNSCAITLQPQTSIAPYFYCSKYLDYCWPGKSLDQVASQVTVDLCAAYKGGFQNTVVYIQSSADSVHFRSHFSPFQWAIRNRRTGEAVFHVDFWGQTGHANVPDAVVLPWVRATLVSKTLKADDITATHHILRDTASLVTSLPTKKPELKSSDIALADLLRDIQLSNRP